MELAEGSEYVALGSSYAAGPGLGARAPDSPRLAARSTRNYAHVLASRLGLRLADVTFSGATVAQIIGREPGATAVPQLDAVTAETRLVTVTAGGNDLGYIGFLVTASLPSLLRAITGGNRRLAELRNDAEFERKGSALANDLIALVNGIRSRAPKAAIVITNYLALLPAVDSASTQPLGREDAERGRRYWNRVNLVLRQATARAGVLFADVSVVSAAHHAWSSDPWTERFVLLGGRAAAYHPTRDGMIAVADAIQDALSRS